MQRGIVFPYHIKWLNEETRIRANFNANFFASVATALMETVIVIPARFGSSRFAGKPLHPVLGISMLERVWRIAKSIASRPKVLIATEDQRVADFAVGFGGDAVMTSEACINGTERVAEAIEARGLASDVVINLQGDALLTPPWVLEAMIHEMHGDRSAEIVTPAVRLQGRSLQEFIDHKVDNPASGTTVVFDLCQHALYFSKMALPFQRGLGTRTLYRHVGLYAYRRKSLEKYVRLSPSPLEGAEGLEQLRALENGMTVRIAIVDYKGRSHGSIDSPADVKLVERIIAQEGELVPDWPQCT